MCAKTTKPNRSLIGSIITNKCPHCRQGNLFIEPNPYNLKDSMKMPEHCPVCNQPYELQTGFYFGTGYVSYALSVAILAASFVIWWFGPGFSLNDNSVFWWLGISSSILILLQPLLQRLSRSIWIAIFVRYDENSGEGKAV